MRILDLNNEFTNGATLHNIFILLVMLSKNNVSGALL